MTALPQKPWFTIKETVFYLGVSRMTVYRWIERGELVVCGLPFMRKISRASLQAKVGQMGGYDE